MSSPSATAARIWRNIALLTFPIWGTLIVLALLSLIGRRGYVPEYLPIALALLIPAVGTVPIFGTGALPTLAKATVFAIYYAIALFAVLFITWISLDYFYHWR